MNKSNFVARLSVLAIALTLVTTSLIGGTLAKYTTEVKGEASATVAKWSFKANEESATMAAINLGNTANTEYLKAGKIAPGSKGSFDIEIDATGTETGLKYIISFSNVQNKIANIEFCKDAACTTLITLNDSGDTEIINETIKAEDTTKKVKETIYWQWKTDTDKADTAIGEGNTSPMTFDIKVTGTQTVETPAS